MKKPSPLPPFRIAPLAHRVRAWGAALGLLAGLPAAGAEPPAPPLQSAQWTRLDYVVAPGETDRVFVLASPGPEGWIVGARRMREAKATAEGGGAAAVAPPRSEQAVYNPQLFPARDPLGQAAPRLQRLAAEADGFTLVVDYVFPDGLERFHLRFGAGRCQAQVQARAQAAAEAPQPPCVWPLQGYRRERIDASGRVASGIVADYVQRSARWLEGGGAAGRAPMPPVGLRAGDAPDLASLGSIFDFSPALDVPVRH